MGHQYTVGEASRYLNIDPKTLHRRCRQIGIIPASSVGGRVKLYSQQQLDLIATSLHPPPRVLTHPSQLGKKLRQPLPLTQLRVMYTHLETLEYDVRLIREQLAELLADGRA